MSVEMSGSVSSYATSWPQNSARDVLAKLNQTEIKFPHTSKNGELRRNAAAEATVRSQRQHLEGVAESLATRTESVAARYEEIGARWSERFASLEAAALERGNDLQAEQIAQIGERVTGHLDDVSQTIVAQLDRLSERINKMLSESYGTVGDDALTPDDSPIEEVV